MKSITFEVTHCKQCSTSTPLFFKRVWTHLRDSKPNDPNAPPKYYRSRSVPYALRDKVDQELQRLLKEGTKEPVEIADWAAPIVPVLKSDKTSVVIFD